MGVGHIYVVVHAQADKGNTRGFLQCLQEDSRLEILEISAGYSWTVGLNVPLRLIAIRNINGIGGGIKFVLNASVEAGFKEEHLRQMLSEFSAECAVVGTSFAGCQQDGQKVDLGRSYKHPRNTGMIINLELFSPFPPFFDDFCNGVGGMEDIDFILQLRAFYNLKVSLLDLKVKLVVGKNHHQPTKEEREQLAMDKIVARVRTWFSAGTKERDVLEEIIAEMAIVS